MWDTFRRLIEWVVLVLSAYTKGRLDEAGQTRIETLEESSRQTDEAVKIREDTAARSDRSGSDKLREIYTGRVARRR